MTDIDYAEFHGIRALNPLDAFCIAATSSKLKEMQLLLGDDVDINGIADYSKMTALCGGARMGAKRSVAFLIEKGADVNLPSANGTTPLMFACSFGKKKGLIVARQLIDAGADVNYANQGEATALTSAIDRPDAEVVRLLIEKGANVEGPVGASQTPLMLAARSGDVATLEVLVAAGADRTATCKLPWAENRTARGLAELEKRRKAVAYFKSLDGD